MTPLVPESYLETRRLQIIEAAVSCFSQKGFHQTTMQDICKTAELSPGAVYNYFRSKEDIVATCAEISLQRNQEIFTTAAAQDTVGAFNEVARALFSIAKQEEIAQAMSFDLEMWAESTRNQRLAEILHNNENTILAQLTDMVEGGQREGVFSKQLDAEAIARVLFALFLGFEVQMASNPNMDIDAYAAVCNAILQGTFSREKEYRHENQ